MLDQKQVGVVNILRKTQGTKLTVSTYNLKKMLLYTPSAFLCKAYKS